MPAFIALIHMAAQSGRTAVANRFKRFSLMRTRYGSPLLEESAFVLAEYIGHFEPMFVHRLGGMALSARTRSSEPSSSSGLLVERAAVSATCRQRAVVFRLVCPSRD